MVERYDAVVTNVDDPDQRFRIKVACAGLLGDESTELPVWVEPLFDWGWVYVPEIGEQVEIEVVMDSELEEVKFQSTIDQAVIRWRGKRYYDSQAQSPTAPIPDEAKTNYGMRRLWHTPKGHHLIFDDSTDEIIILLANGAAIKITGSEGDAITILGDGAKSAVIAETLQAWWDNQVKLHLENLFNGITSWVPVPQDGGAALKAALATYLGSPPPAFDAGAVSSKLKLPDG